MHSFTGTKPIQLFYGDEAYPTIPGNAAYQYTCGLVSLRTGCLFDSLRVHCTYPLYLMLSQHADKLPIWLSPGYAAHIYSIWCFVGMHFLFFPFLFFPVMRTSCLFESFQAALHIYTWSVAYSESVDFEVFKGTNKYVHGHPPSYLLCLRLHPLSLCLPHDAHFRAGMVLYTPSIATKRVLLYGSTLQGLPPGSSILSDNVSGLIPTTCYLALGIWIPYLWECDHVVACAFFWTKM